MPGLSQLRKLSEDVLRLGNEPKLRAERGEKPVVAKIPSSVQDIDDSDDFVLGMPEKEIVEVSENLNDDSVESLNLENNSLSDTTKSSSSIEEPDLSGLLNPINDIGSEMPDLSAFEEPKIPPKKEEPILADMSLDDLLKPSNPEPVEEVFELDSLSSGEQGELNSSIDTDLLENLTDSFEDSKNDSLGDSQSFEDDFDSNDVIDLTMDIPDEFNEFIDKDSPENKLEKLLNEKSTSIEDKEPSEVNNESMKENVDNSTENENVDFGTSDFSSGFDFGDIDTSGLDDFSDGNNAENSTEDFSLDSDFGDINFDSENLSADGGVGLETSNEINNDNNLGSDALNESSNDDNFGKDFSNGFNIEDSFDDSSMEHNFSDSDINEDSSDILSNLNQEAQISTEVFDTSEMDDVQFNETDSSSMSDFNIIDTDSQLNGASDFELDSQGAMESDFEIAGYTDIDANPFDENGRIKSQLSLEPEVRTKNSLTDVEYEKFKTNLKYYPLNVRLVVEELIVKNEFTDDVIFEIIEKILKRVPARQLASHLEKMLDIQLPVPRDFERRTAEEFEAYKASLQYQLKNKIIPAAILGIIVLMVGLCSAYLTVEYIVNPIRAEIIYKEGYNLIELNEYPQSESKFNEALKIKQKKKWFFKYARAYRSHKQFDRAELMYKNILSRFNHDKQGGMEYARMQLDDLANYPRAEEIVRREILDYHINDVDAMLLLGDIFLEWGTETDPAKFEEAFEQYSYLKQFPKPPKEIDARLMVYSVRTDKLKDVLSYKELFYPEENSLTGDEWTEMSGYLMDKLYGNLIPSEEYLRASIEDVYSMLIRAIKKSPENPISRYNMARYFINSANKERAIPELDKTIALFDKAVTLKKRDIYKYINSYRLLGERYIDQREYLRAKENFIKGINLFEEKNQLNGFESDKNVGITYADLADIDYFISGDLDNAERNYVNSINNKNDNSSIRYKLGYINYRDEDYEDAVNHFLVASKDKDSDLNLMLALGNSLSLKDDNFASVGYYQRLIELLDFEIEKKDIILPQINEEDTYLVDMYLKATNNIGVGQFRIARETGNSNLNGQSMNNLQESLRAWDSFTRNPVTMVRLPGTNLAEQNLKYIINPVSTFEPAIYTDIPRIMQNEKGLE